MKRACLLLASLAILGITACEDDPDPIIPPEPIEATLIEFISALPATGTVGDQIPVTIRARTPTQKNVAGKLVTFRVESGGGSVAPGSVTTDSAGRATAVWTLGQAPAQNSLIAAVDTVLQRATVTTSPAPASRLTVVSGGNQTGSSSTTLTQPVVVRVTDRFNNPTPGAVVTFSTADGGIVTPTTATANAQGQAQVSWTLGQRSGTQRLIARVDTASLTITATATGGPAVSGEIVVPTNVTAGDSIQLVFRTRDQFGNESTTRPTTFTVVNNAQLVTMTPSGALRALAAGSVTVLASADGATAVATFSIAPFRWTRLDAGNAHTCAIAQVDSRMYCWGEGSAGSIGNAALGDALIPTAVSGGRTYTRVAAGLQFTCAVGTDARAYCWGNNASGQTGVGVGGTINTPTQVASTESFSNVSTGVTGACGLSTTGRAICWGGSALPADFSNGLVFTQISGSPAGGHACGITADGTLYCWGRNNFGQLGNNTTTDSAVPVLVFTGDRWSNVVVGEDHTCGVGSENGLQCWGRAELGQLGNPLQAPVVPLEGCTLGLCRKTPTPVENAPGVNTLDAYGHSTCGTSTIGEVYCWGVDTGNLGNASDPIGNCGCDQIPVQVVTALRFQQVSVGGTHSCGITTFGDIYCWGANDFGQLGRNTRDAAGTLQRTPVAAFAPRR